MFHILPYMYIVHCMYVQYSTPFRWSILHYKVYTIQCFGIPYCIIHCKPFWCFVLYHTLYTCLVFLLYHTLYTVLVFHILPYTANRFGVSYCIIHCTLYTCLVFLLYHTLQTVLVFHIVSYIVHLFDVPIVPYTLHRFGVPYFTIHCTYSVYQFVLFHTLYTVQTECTGGWSVEFFFDRTEQVH